MLQSGSPGCHIHFHHLIDKNHQMRVAHRYFHSTAKSIALAQDHFTDPSGNSHIYGHRGYGSVLRQVQIKLFDSGQRFQRNHRLVRQSLFIQIFSNAPGSIATHHGLRTVRIEYPHAEIRHIRFSDQYQTVTADSDMGTAPFHRTLLRVVYRIKHGVHIDIIIT